MMRYSVLLVITLLLSFNCGDVFGTDLKPMDVSFSTPPERLRYEISCLNAEEIVKNARHLAVDVRGDGTYRFLRFYSSSSDSGGFATAIDFYNDACEANAYYEYHGSYATSYIWSHRSIDLEDNYRRDIVMTKTHADSIVFEILHLDSLGVPSETTLVVAATALYPKRFRSWLAVDVQALAAIDLNHDGAKDLIYSCSAAPDSQVERGIVAYDLKNQTRLWFFPTADPVSPHDFHVIDGPDGGVLFVFNTQSCANAYASSNGMDSEHAYLIAVDSSGRQLWRHILGGGFFYPSSVSTDADGNGTEEVFVTRSDNDTSAANSFWVEGFNPLSGELVRTSEEIRFPGADLHLMDDATAHQSFILATYKSGSAIGVTKLNMNLEIERSCFGASFVATSDVNDDGHPELLLKSSSSQFALTDGDFRLLGSTSSGFLAGADSAGWKNAKIIPLSWSFVAVRVLKRPFLTLLLARYKWFIMFIPVVIFVMVLVGRRLTGVYFSLQGLPSISTLNAMVMVFNRNKRIVYYNKHPLTSLFLGENTRRWPKWSRTALGRYQELSDFLDSSFREHFSISQEQFEIETANGTLRLWVSAYPRVDQDRRFQGKIIVVEDLGSQANFRKVFLNEALQGIVHTMKTRLVAVSWAIGNMKEDPSLSEVTAHPTVEKYLNSLSCQTDQLAQMCKDILKYASLPKPRLEPTGVNILIEQAVQSILHQIEEIPHRIDIARELQEGLPKAMIDEGQIRGVIDNLLSNSIKAMKDGGAITIRSRMASNLLSESVVKMVEIRVQDTGIGIDSEDMKRIFEPGYSKSGSTGIGLALAKEIIKNHGGTIDVESEVGKGSCFTIRIPVDSEGK